MNYGFTDLEGDFGHCVASQLSEELTQATERRISWQAAGSFLMSTPHTLHRHACRMTRLLISCCALPYLEQ